MSFFPIPGVGLGGLVPSPNPIISTGPKSFFPSPTLVLDGLPLTNDEFRTHRLPMPKLHLTGHTTRLFAAPTEESRLSYAIYDQHDTSRSNCARHATSSGDLDRQHTVTSGLIHGRLQWVRHVRRSSASFEGPTSFVTAYALDPPRLRDPTRSSCFPPPDAGPSWTTHARSSSCPANHCCSG